MPSRVEPTRKEQLAWRDIRDNAELALSFIATMTVDEFTEDRRTFYAVTRCLEIISEASRRLRGTQQDRYPDLEWRQIEDSGNVFRHRYNEVEESQIWFTVRDRLPDLLAATRSALGDKQA